MFHVQHTPSFLWHDTKTRSSEFDSAINRVLEKNIHFGQLHNHPS